MSQIPSNMVEDLTKICEQCKGEGVIPDPNSPEGSVFMTMCPRCEGDGWIWIEAEEIDGN